MTHNEESFGESSLPSPLIRDLLRRQANETENLNQVADDFRRQWRKRGRAGILSIDRGFLSEDEAAGFLVEFGLLEDLDTAKDVLSASTVTGSIWEDDERLIPYRGDGSMLKGGIVSHVDKRGTAGYRIAKYNFRPGFPG